VEGSTLEFFFCYYTASGFTSHLKKKRERENEHDSESQKRVDFTLATSI